MIQEFYGPPDHACVCGGSWRMVFTEFPQMRTQHASVVDEVMRNNQRIQDRIIEEDSEPTSPSGQALLNYIMESDNLGGH